jgi:hypothetical protein
MDSDKNQSFIGRNAKKIAAGAAMVGALAVDTGGLIRGSIEETTETGQGHMMVDDGQGGKREASGRKTTRTIVEKKGFLGLGDKKTTIVEFDEERLPPNVELPSDLPSNPFLFR